MSRLERYLKHERWFVAAMLGGFLLVETTINATTLLMEAAGSPGTQPVWWPFALEYSSGLAMLALFPLILMYERRFPMTWDLFRRNFGWHVLGSLAFTLLHMGLMTLLRKLLSLMIGRQYSLGDLSWELLYEYRKDAWTYAGLLTSIYIYRFIVSRLRGEASLIAEGESAPVETVPDRLLVKKLGREFIVRVDEIEWLESAGNYVNLHLGKRIYPLRSTMNALAERLESRGFLRTHRSFAVNLDFVAAIRPLESGDAEITLANGHTLPLSRRYREAFRQHLEFEDSPGH